MQALIIAMMDRFGYLGIASLIALENIFPPIPSEVILTFGGFLTTYTNLDVWLVIAAATAGSMVGAVFLYGVGWALTPERLRGLLSGKLGKILHLYPEDVDKSIFWFQKKGKAAVFFCRFVPIIRSLISIPAGFAGMAPVPFLVLTLVGSSIWNTVLIWLGAAAGASWSRIVGYTDAFGSAVRVILLAGVAAGGLYLIRRQGQKPSPGQKSH